MIDYSLVAVVMFGLCIPLYSLTDGAVIPRLPIVHFSKVEPELLDERQAFHPDGKAPVVHRTYLLKITYYGAFETHQIEDQVIEPKDGYATRSWERHSVRKNSAGEWQTAVIPTSTDLTLIAMWLMFMVVEASMAGASPGKRVMSLRVVDMNNQPISLGTSVKRNILKIVSIVPFGLGILLAIKSNKTLTLHDRLSKTQVISTKV